VLVALGLKNRIEASSTIPMTQMSPNAVISFAPMADHRRHRRIWPFVVVVLALFVIVVQSADADLRPGSRRAILTKGGGLREPLPRLLRSPRILRAKDGRLAIDLRAGFRVSNWNGSVGARRDRAMVVLSVARRLLRNGPSSVDRVFARAWTDHRLRHRHAARHYRFAFSRAASRFLRHHGVLSKKRAVRGRALRLISVRIEQDRDFKHVDGGYDWREGAAYSAADRIVPPLRPDEAQASGSAHPEGTLSITNATAAGVYCQQGCPQWDSSTEQPGSVAGTENSSYAAPLAVAGTASVCFEQGSHGSNPEGFDYVGANGQPQPYTPGSVISGYDNGEEELPLTDGTTVTEGITAYDGLQAPSEEESAIAATAATESLNLGLLSIKVGAGLPASAFGFAIGFPSPGAIVSGILGLAEFLINRSCDGAPNLLALSAAEQGGAAFSAQIQAQVQDFAFYHPESGSAAGVQLNPSTLSQGGSPLYLMPRMVKATGLADNVCDCRGSTGNNAIYLEWANYDPCGPYYGTGLDCSASAPTTSETVGGAGSEVDCGPGNTACDFPAAQGAPTPSTTKPSGIGEVGACATILRAGTTLTGGQAVTSPNGTYTLAMLTNGTLSWFDGPANSLWASTQAATAPAGSQGPAGISAGSHMTMQEDGNFVVYTPQGTPIFATGTNGNPGAYLALQSDGNLVVYNAAGQPLWASNTYKGPACG
jgi:hypothetical protein